MSEFTHIEHHDLTRADLLHFPEDGRRQAAAWGRLRRVCLDLNLVIPSRAEVQAMEADLVGMQGDLERTAGLFPEEGSRLVICARAADGAAVFLQFSSGYILGETEPAASP